MGHFPYSSSYQPWNHRQRVDDVSEGPNFPPPRRVLGHRRDRGTGLRLGSVDADMKEHFAVATNSQVFERGLETGLQQSPEDS